MTQKQILIAPSILSANFVDLKNEINKVEDAGADWLHIDVMDGRFVPNITIGIPVVESIKKTTKLPLDVHLMIVEPIKYIKGFAEAGADIITVHIEACDNNIKETLDEIKKYNIKSGISIKPNTPVKKLENLIDEIDLILIMTVEPGFGGQKFIYPCLEKIKEIQKIAQKRNPNLHIEIDGGINSETAKLCIESGADVLVAGSYIYKSNNIKAAINSLKTL